MYESLFAIIEKQPRSRPALVWDEESITYQDLVDRAVILARALDLAAIKAGDRICVHIDKSPEVVALYLACLRCGAVFVPLGVDYTDAELQYLLDDCDPALIICRPEFADQPPFSDSSAPLFTLGRNGGGSLLKQAAAVSPPAAETTAPDDVAAILYTSGTTGRPKGAMLTHENLLSNARTLIDAWRITPADRLIHALPLHHTHGLFVALNTTLISGASAYLLPRFDAADVIRLMPEATIFMGVPTHYFRLLANPQLPTAARGMRLFVSGSAPLSAAVHKRFLEQTGHVVLERYGMTETCMIASNPYNGERRPGSVGPALPGVDVRVTNPATGEQVLVHEVGVVEVRGPNVFKGFWRDAEQTAATVRDDGYFVTGDLGYLDAQAYLTLVGRQKDLIISGGLNVYPAEVESVIEELDEVSESAVIGVPHEDFGEAVVAVIAPKPNIRVDADAVRAHLKTRLAKYKQPKKIYFVPDLPRNSMGKIKKKELRVRYSDA